jgi:hypothetical protein
MAASATASMAASMKCWRINGINGIGVMSAIIKIGENVEISASKLKAKWQ